MDGDWAAPTWVVVMSIVLGIGAAIVWNLGTKMVERSKVPMSHRQWYSLLEEHYLAIVHKLRELGETVAAAQEARANLPREYQATLDQVLMLARLVENSSFEEAQARGLVKQYWFGGPFTPAETGEQPESQHVYQVPPSQRPPPPSDNVFELPDRQWVRGQLVKTTNGKTNGSASA